MANKQITKIKTFPIYGNQPPDDTVNTWLATQQTAGAVITSIQIVGISNNVIMIIVTYQS